MPFLRDEKLAALERVLGSKAQTRGDEVIFYCPIRPHRRPKLYVNLHKDFFQCWVCGFKGRSLSPLLELFGKTTDSERYLESSEPNLALSPDSLGLLESSIAKQIPPPKPLSLPNGFKTLSEPHQSSFFNMAWGHLKSRGIGLKEVLRFRLGYCEEGEYWGRIIIPSFDERGRLNFYTGRTFVGAEQRYRNSPVSRNDIVFNDCFVDWHQPVTILEGPLDCIKTGGDNATCLLGSVVGRENALLRKIIKFKPETYLALDADAQEKQDKLAELLLGFGVTVRVIPLGKFSDVGEMSEEEFRDKKKSAILLTPGLDFLKRKVQKVSC